jgi:hypothetical protein
MGRNDLGEHEKTMDISLELLAELSPEMARELIPQWLCGFVAVGDVGRAAMIDRVNHSLNQFSDEALLNALDELVHVGDHYQLYPANPVARAMSRSFMRSLTTKAQIDGIENLRSAMAQGPVLMFSNHLAYCDTQLKDVLLTDAGASDLANTILAVAGPKVYGTVFRRFASVALTTMKTAQSSSTAHNESGLSPREVATIAIETVHRAVGFMGEGRPVLIYAEGSRSRDGRLQPFLRAVRKYTKVPGLRMVPVAISGSNRMMPINQPRMFPVPVTIQIGEPVDAAAAGGGVSAITEVWKRIGIMLPQENKPLAETAAIA